MKQNSNANNINSITICSGSMICIDQILHPKILRLNQNKCKILDVESLRSSRKGKESGASMWEAEPASIRRTSGRGASSHKPNIHGDADRHAERGDDVGSMVSRPDCVGGMVSSDPTPACGKGTHQSLIQWAGTTSIVVGSSPLSGQYRERRLASSSGACRVRPVSLVCLVHLVDLVCLVSLVFLVYLVALVCLVSFVFRTRPTKQTRQTKQTRSIAVVAQQGICPKIRCHGMVSSPYPPK